MVTKERHPLSEVNFAAWRGQPVAEWEFRPELGRGWQVDGVGLHPALYC